jgi:hypothetical protein
MRRPALLIAALLSFMFSVCLWFTGQRDEGMMAAHERTAPRSTA